MPKRRATFILDSLSAPLFTVSVSQYRVLIKAERHPDNARRDGRTTSQGVPEKLKKYRWVVAQDFFPFRTNILKTEL